MKVRSLFVLGAILALAGAFVFQCTEKYPASQQKIAFSKNDGCVGCHTDAARLKDVATPLPPVSGETGEG